MKSAAATVSRFSVPALDPVLSLVGLSLLLIGLIAISSASVEYADWHFKSAWHHTQRHLVYIVLAIAAAAVVYRVPPRFWLQTGWVWLFSAIALLILVLLPGIGKDVNGSQRWLPLGPFTLQPSELAKLALVIYFAGYLVRQEYEVRNKWEGFFRPMAVLGSVVLLLMVEPDFGATVIVVCTVFGMLFLAGVKLSYFLLVLGVSMVGMLGLVLSAPYRVQRLTAYTRATAILVRAESGIRGHRLQ